MPLSARSAKVWFVVKTVVLRMSTRPAGLMALLTVTVPLRNSTGPVGLNVPAGRSCVPPPNSIVPAPPSDEPAA